MRMDFFSEDRHSVVSPREMVLAFMPSAGGLSKDLPLERLALITFTTHDLHGFLGEGGQGRQIKSWRKRARTIHKREGWIVVQSPYGAPGTVMLLEELAAFGVRRAIFVGYCGSIQDWVKIGGIVLPVEAIREEGTSYHYLPKGEKSCPDTTLQSRLSNWLLACGLSCYAGRIWTTDAPYRETVEKVRRYGNAGVLGVEMEMAAAFAFGSARGISIGAVLLVSDEVREGGWRTGFFSPELKAARERVIRILIRRIEELIP